MAVRDSHLSTGTKGFEGGGAGGASKKREKKGKKQDGKVPLKIRLGMAAGAYDSQRRGIEGGKRESAQSNRETLSYSSAELSVRRKECKVIWFSIG